MRRSRSTTSSGRDPARTIGLWLLAGLLSFGCGLGGNDAVRVKVIFTDTNPARQLADVTAVVGSDKFFWGRIAAGAVKTVTLKPGPKDDRQLTLIYTLDGTQKYWESPKFDVGKGYMIEIKIDQQGAATHRHCFLPCSLD